MTHIYVVVVRNNIVTALEQHPASPDTPVPRTKLEIGTQLADNFRANGSIDGRYLFQDGRRASIFAVLCLEFVRALVDKRLEAVRSLATGAEYHAPEHSSNRSGS